MLENQVETKQENKPSVGFKFQISKEKVEQMHFENSMKNIEEIIVITQKELNQRRLFLLFITYSLIIIVANLLIYNYLKDMDLSFYIYTIVNLIVTFPFLFLSKRDAPINESDIKKTFDKM